MKLEEIQRHVHYKPAGKPCVCGFRVEVYAKLKDDADPDFSVMQIRCTTDVSLISCPRCISWLEGVVGILKSVTGIVDELTPVAAAATKEGA